jgi:hypothetical protein
MADEREMKTEADVNTASVAGRASAAKRAASTNAAREGQLLRDCKTLATFVEVYCKHRHREMRKAPVGLKTHDVVRIHGRNLELCASCRKLLAHAFVKRSHCPFDPKPLQQSWMKCSTRRITAGIWARWAPRNRNAASGPPRNSANGTRNESGNGTARDDCPGARFPILRCQPPHYGAARSA